MRPVRITSPAATSSRYPSAPSPREPPTSKPHVVARRPCRSATTGSGYPVEGRRIPASAFAADSAAAEPGGTRIRDAGVSVKAAPGDALTETGLGTTLGGRGRRRTCGTAGDRAGEGDRQREDGDCGDGPAGQPWVGS